MKRFFIILLIVGCLCFGTSSLVGAVLVEEIGASGDNLIWSFEGSSAKLVIVGTGDMCDYSETNPAPWSQYASKAKSISIDKGITRIGDYAFAGFSKVSNLYISDTVTEIGDYAFSGCSYLQRMVVNDTVSSVEYSAFLDCSSLTDITYTGTAEEWQSISIADGNDCFSSATVKFHDDATCLIGGKCGDNLTWSLDLCTRTLTISGEGEMYDYNHTIGSEEAPWDDMTVYDIIIEDGVTAIDDYAFMRSEAYTVTLGSDLAVIGDNAFSSNWNLMSISIPDSVTGYGNSCFSSCNNLLKVELPDNIQNISYGMFSSCYSLCDIDLPYGLRSIGGSAFYSCDSITSIDIPESVTYIGNRCFSSCSSITSIKIPSGVTTIENSTFSYCSKLKTVTLHNNLLKIGDRAFSYCNSIEEFDIPESVTSIGVGAFMECNKIESIDIPDSVVNIGENAFYCCRNLTNLKLGKSVSSLKSDVFSATALESVTIPESVVSIAYNAFESTNSLKNITVDPENSAYSSVDGILFNKDKSILVLYPVAREGESYSIPLGVCEIGDYAFYHNLNLKHLYIPETTVRVGDYSFASTGISAITGCLGLTEFGERCFSACKSLIKIDFPVNLNILGTHAFEYCSALKSLTIPGTVNNVGDYAFYDCDALETVVINDGVKEISCGMFYACSNLKNVTIPDSVTLIETRAFEGCSAIEELKIPWQVQTINMNAFSNCKSLKIIELPKNLSVIEYGLFSECTSLVDVSIPENVTKINSRAFYGCTNLETVKIPESVTYISTSAFDRCSKLAKVYYSGNEAQWNQIVIYSGNTYLTNADVEYQIKGNCGSSATWKLDSGVLVISGTGAISDYTSNKPSPWSEHSSHIKEIVVEEGISAIGKSAFANLGECKTVTLPDSVDTVGMYAFLNCTNLETVNIDGTLSLIKKMAFSGCNELKSVNATGTYEDYKNLTFETGNLPFERAYIKYTSDVGTVYASMSIYAKWIYNDSDKKLEIYNYPHVLSRDMLNFKNFESIPWNEFQSELKTVEIEGVSSVGSRSLLNASNLGTVLMGSSITKVNSWAFSNCPVLKTVKLSPELKSVGTGAFYKTEAIDNVIFENTRENYNKIIFSKSNLSLQRTNTVMSDGIYGFQGGKIYWFLDTDGTLTISGKGAMLSKSSAEQTPWYSYNNDIKRVVVEEGVTQLGKLAFSGIANLESVEIAEGVTIIGTYAFSDSSIGTVKLPSTVTTVGTGAFKNSSINEIVYNGTEADYANITVGTRNDAFVKASKSYLK